jgi:hypothetical protein
VIARASVTIGLAPQALWDVLVRWETQTDWMKDAASVRVLGARREGTGVRLAVRTRVLGVPLFTEELEVTRWEPPIRLEVAHRSFVRGTGTWTLAPDGEGTRLRWSEALSLPVPLVGELALRAYRPVLRRLMQGGLERLRVSLARPPG